MGKRKRVCYPNPQPPALVPCYVNQPGDPAFIAYGESPSNILLDTSKVFLVGKGVGKQAWGTILMQTPHWIVMFSNAALTKANGPYSIDITDMAGAPMKSENFDVADPPKPLPKLPPKVPYATDITSPSSGETVGPNFTTYGDTSSNGPMTGTLTDGNGKTYNGNTVQDGPLWVIQFTNIPQGFYTLTVDGTNLPTSTQVSPVIVTPTAGGGGG
jgi:hypothetical protein